MDRYLAYDPNALIDLRAAIDAAIWHIAASRFDHAYCDEFRTSVLGIRPRLEELRDTVLQPVIDSDALEAFLACGPTIAPIVVDGEVLDEPDEIREFLEAKARPDSDNVADHGLVAATMLELTPAEAAAYWATLTGQERRDLIDRRPDLAGQALEGGATLTDGELGLLDSSNAFVQFSEEFGVEINAHVDVRWATVSVGMGYSVAAMRMSDGTVQVAIVKDSELGVGVESDSDDGATAAASVGAFTSSEHVFVFPDEEAAEAAIGHLQAEIQTYDLGDWAEDVADWISGPLEWGNYDNDFETFVKETWEEFGMVRRSEGGVYGEVAAEVESDLAEASSEARVSVSVYDTDTTELASEVERTGIVVAGSLGVHAESRSDTGGSVSAEGSFTVDAYTNADGEFITLTVLGSASTGVVAQLIDDAGVDVDEQTEAGAQATVTVTVPLTADQVRGVVTSLTAGRVPEALAGLYEEADITVALDATADVTTEAEIDAGVVGVSIEHSQTDRVNLVTVHKLPDGEFYSQNELNASIDVERGLVPSGEEVTATYGADAQVVYEGGEASYIDTGDACAILPPTTTA